MATKKQKTLNENIQSYSRKLKSVFKNVDANKKKVVEPLIERAAFLQASLEELEKKILEKGYIEAYQNGEKQSGYKKSAEADLHSTYTKNYSTIIKQLIEICPDAPKAKSKLAMLRGE